MRKGTASVSCSTDWRLQPGPCSRLGLADQVPTTWNAAVSSLRSSGIKSALDKAAISESLTGSPPVPSSGDPPLPDTHSSATRYSPHRYHFSLLNTLASRLAFGFVKSVHTVTIRIALTR